LLKRRIAPIKNKDDRLKHKELFSHTSKRSCRWRFFVYFGFLVLVFPLQKVQAQEAPAAYDSSTVPTFKGALLRSALVPGWGQIYQERLLPAAALYSTSAVFAYRTLFHLYYYQKYGTDGHKKLLYTNLEITAGLYALNLLDVTYAALYKHPRGWQGGLLDDRPLKSPWGAVLRSAILPGWGQAYTENYWKAAAYFLVDGYFIYQIRKYDVAFQSSGDPKDRDQRSRFSWYFGLAYLITMADAYAGAYLYKFDEAMKMTLLPALEGKKLMVTLNVRF